MAKHKLTSAADCIPMRIWVLLAFSFRGIRRFPREPFYGNGWKQSQKAFKCREWYYISLAMNNARIKDWFKRGQYTISILKKKKTFNTKNPILSPTSVPYIAPLWNDIRCTWAPFVKPQFIHTHFVLSKRIRRKNGPLFFLAHCVGGDGNWEREKRKRDHFFP